MIDCGEDWRGALPDLRPRAVVVTHAHPDHAFGLKGGAPCPVYATRSAWIEMADYPLERRHTVSERQPLEIEGITFEAFGVEHSTRAPAVSYRVSAGRARIFYAPAPGNCAGSPVSLFRSPADVER